MTIAENLLPEFDQEMANTRKMLERVSEDKLTWKPHEKSMDLGSLASHVAEMAGWMVPAIKQSAFEVPADYRPFVARSRRELLETLDKNVAAAREALSGVTDEHLMQPWSLIMGGQTAFSMPRTAVIRTMLINHMIHHRGQLSVYLRLNNIAVPGMYGPSADENQTSSAQTA